MLLVLIYVIAGVPAAPRTVRASDFPRPSRDGIRTFTAAVLTGMVFGLLWGVSAVLKNEGAPTPPIWPALGTGLLTGIDFAVGAWLFRWSRQWFRAPPGTDPRSAARLDLAGAILRPLILGVTFTVSFGVSAPFHFVAAYLLPWFVVGVAFGFLETEWPLYAAAISWLALARTDLPVRLMRFLECCRAAGILRVIGQEYQIHDIGLLGYLRSAHQPFITQVQPQPITGPGLIKVMGYLLLTSGTPSGTAGPGSPTIGGLTPALTASGIPWPISVEGPYRDDKLTLRAGSPPAALGPGATGDATLTLTRGALQTSTQLRYQLP